MQNRAKQKNLAVERPGYHGGFRTESGAVDPWLCVPDFRTGLPLFLLGFSG